MNKIIIGALALSLVATTAVVAQPRAYSEMSRDNGQHRGWGQERVDGYQWRRGQRMGYNNWNNAQRVEDYRSHNLRRPQRGYEWRESNGQYVLGAIATGVIASAILNNHR